MLLSSTFLLYLESTFTPFEGNTLYVSLQEVFLLFVFTYEKVQNGRLYYSVVLKHRAVHTQSKNSQIIKPLFTVVTFLKIIFISFCLRQIFLQIKQKSCCSKEQTQKFMMICHLQIQYQRQKIAVIAYVRHI